MTAAGSICWKTITPGSGARVAALAQASEVLVTSTVKMLVLGSGIGFADRGRHRLKGVPDQWQLFAVEHT